MASSRHSENERIKREYLEFRKYAGRLSQKSLDKEIAAIERFDAWNRRKDFRRFRIEQAKAFRDFLDNARNDKTRRPLGASTKRAILAPLRNFFAWLATRPGYRKRISPADADYFNLSRRDAAVASSSDPRPAPTSQQVRHALSLMPEGTDIERRDKAVFALLFLTAVRDGALISLRLKHVDPVDRCLWQNSKEVETKSGKTFRTYFQPGVPEAEAALAHWVCFQREKLLRGSDDPLFPKTEMGLDEAGRFRAVGVSREHWRTAQPVRDIVRRAFEAAGIPPFGPHSFRHMHAREALRSGASVEEFWAVSQNLGHSSMLTTLRSYGQLPEHRRRELILGES